MRLLAFFSWLVRFFLPGISLGVAPASYMYLGFPLKYIMPIIVVFGGFFRPIMNHRIPNVMFNWPNPALLGAVLSGYVHTGVCALFFFLSILLHSHHNCVYTCTYGYYNVSVKVKLKPMSLKASHLLKSPINPVIYFQLIVLR